ncbi:retrovirus-related pol polyprotein from transposon TNT 1-94 [Tanacetum coccineum]
MGPQRRLGIYVGYETSSIIRYVEPLTGDVFTARFADCHFNEANFPPLGEKKKPMRKMSHGVNLPSANAPARVELPNKQAGNNIAQESQKRLKRGRPIGSKDKNPRKRKGTEKNSDHDENVLDETQDIKTSPEEEMNDMNKEMSINYSQTNILWDRNEIGDIDEIFSYSVASDIMGGDDDPEPKSDIDCQSRPDRDKWKDAMQAQLNSLNKRKVFGPIVTTPRDVKPVGCRWIFVQKINEKNEVTRYLISLAVSINLEMRLMDVVTTYLYGSIDNDIYMKILEGFKIPESLSSKPKEIKGYKSNRICPCVFIKKTTSGFVIIAVYVDDLNMIGTNKEINEVIMHLKVEFEMKDLGKTKYCLGLQIEHMPNSILVHQSNYTETVLKRFNMDKAKSLSTPMVGRSLNVDNDPFRPCEEGEDVLGPEVPYLSAIGALMYLTNCTRPDISFTVNLLARFSSSPTKRHWNGIKHIFRYLRGSIDLGLFYSNNSKQGLVGYAHAGYLSDPHKARSQTGYIFLNGGTIISWRSQKQTLVATSSNHAEVIALHEALKFIALHES